MTIKTLFLKSAFQTKGSLNQNTQMGTLGGIFQSHRHGKKFMSVFQSKKKKKIFIVVKQVPFMSCSADTKVG